MSDPVTNAEVEDVLSSIRRLVSEEKRPAATGRAAPKQDRLMLTPALRIEGDTPSKADGVTSELSDFKFGTTTKEPQERPDETAYQLENPQNLPFELSQETLLEDATPTGDVDSTTENDYATDPYNFDDETDVDGDSDTVLTLTPETRSDTAWNAPEPAATEPEFVHSPRDTFQDETVTQIYRPDTKAATLSAKIEALESAIGGIEDDFEPDEAGTDAYSGTEAPSIDWEGARPEDTMPAVDVSEDDEIEAEALETETTQAASEEEIANTADFTFGQDLAEEIAQDEINRVEEAVIVAASTWSHEDDEPFPFAVDGRVIDEEALRDMVGDIVRAELQGALGERITRNVRKLVRREIHRALTTQDLE